MTIGFSATDVTNYQRDGYVCSVEVMSSADAAGYRAKLEASEAAAGGALAVEHRHKPHLVYTWAQDLIRHPGILDVVEKIIGPDILVWEAVLFMKEPHTEGFVSWHQDITYWGLDQEGDVVTAWLALTPSTLASGCMSVVPKSHLSDVVPHRDTFDDNNMLSRGQEISVDVSNEEIVDLILGPGQMSLHHVKIFHGSAANQSDDRRIGFAVRYLPPHVRQQAGVTDSATLVRGTDGLGYFEAEPRPATDLDPSAVEVHKSLRDRRLAVQMRGYNAP